MFKEMMTKAINDVGSDCIAVLMGVDGIPVEIINNPSTSLDMEIVGMEFSVLLKNVRKAYAELNAGNARELTVKSDNMSTITHMINEEYFVTMTLFNNGNLGKARHIVHLLALELKSTL